MRRDDRTPSPTRFVAWSAVVSPDTHRSGIDGPRARAIVPAVLAALFVMLAARAAVAWAVPR